MPEYTKHYINGAWVAPAPAAAGRALLDVFDSNTGEVFARAPNGCIADSNRAIEAAHAAFPAWSRTTVAQRRQFLERILDEYHKRQAAVAAALERELGAPRLFAQRVQSAMFTFHWAAVLKLAEEGGALVLMALVVVVVVVLMLMLLHSDAVDVLASDVG